MPSKIPLHTIILAREDGRDAKGEPKFKRVTPEIGKPFDFTDEEHKSIIASRSSAVRDPQNETGDPEAAAQKGAEAAAEAAKRQVAEGDAASIASTAARGKAKNKNPSGAATAEETDEDPDTL